jgi:hypothetical protein
VNRVDTRAWFQDTLSELQKVDFDLSPEVDFDLPPERGFSNDVSMLLH